MTKKPIHEKSLIDTIWFRPSETLKFILERCPNKYVSILLVLGGISRGIARASNKNMGDNMETWLVLTISIIAGGLFGWMSYYIYAWALSATGKWINGKAGTDKFKTIIAWSLIPSIVALLLLIPELIIFGDGLFQSYTSNNSNAIIISYFIFGILELILGVWSLVILVKGIALIQNFSIGKSILNLIIPILIILVPILFITLAIGTL